jgi:hypothetical protein
MITTVSAPTRSTPLIPTALASAGLALALTAMGTAEPFRDSDVGPAWDEWFLYNAPVIVAATVLVFGVITRRALPGDVGRLARTALVLGILSVASLAVFWTGLPAVLAGATALCAVQARARGAGPAGPIAALGLSAFTVAVAVAGALLG